MKASETEKTALRLSRRAMKTLRDVKSDLKHDGLYATHELIVDYLLLNIDIDALRIHLEGVPPVPRGQWAKKGKRRRLR